MSNLGVFIGFCKSKNYNAYMSETCRKGDYGQMMIIAEAAKRGYGVLVPLSNNIPYDMVVDRHGKLERVQCKYTESQGDLIKVRARSCSEWVHYKYKPTDIDWLITYDKTTDACYFVPSLMLGPDGRSGFNLRLKPTKNNQAKNVLWAKNFTKW